ncbi:CLUMA_CG017271, isoform A [Clunio marinus]|uniref:CLUMA_CG017271, isoform A n=1 Tax=Clunio marinus TaxID=568069 RepID=A0A1J1IVM9_9DIPT|nr:CLUMA_CG017271, isoform A [Clunio marinus]
MKLFLISLLALIAVASAGPAKVADNNVGDIVTVGVNVEAKVKSEINQDIVNIIVALLNDQEIRLGGGPSLPRRSGFSPEMINQLRSLLVTP